MTNFMNFRNNVYTTLASGYTAGGNSFITNSGQVFGTAFPIAITIITNPTYRTTSEILGIYQATGVLGNTLTGISGIENTTDRNYSIGDVVEMRWTAGEANLISSSISGLQNYTNGGPFHFIFGGGNNLVTGTDLSETYPVASNSGYFQRVDLSVKTAPTGTAIITDIFKSSNHGSSWTSLWFSNGANRPTIAANQNFGSQTIFDTTTYSQGDWFRIDMLQVGLTASPGIGLYVKLS